MPLRNSDRKLSFTTLATFDAEFDEVTISRCPSDPSSFATDGAVSSPQSPKKKRKKKRSKKSVPSIGSIEESSIIDGVNGEAIDSITNNYSYTVLETPPTIVLPEVLDRGGDDYLVRSASRAPHLRQRSVTFTVTTESESAAGNGESKSFSCDGELVEKDDETESKLPRPFEMNGRPLEKEVSLDWKKIMAEDPNYAYHVEKSPIKYFLEEMHAGNSLRRTVNLGNEKERERVYNTLFQLPWRIELLINVGFFVCLDSFLSLLTIMPARNLMVVWRVLKTSSRDLQRLNYLILDVSLFWFLVFLYYSKQTLVGYTT